MDELVEWLRVQLDEDERSGSVAHCADCSRGSEYAGTMYECDVDAARDRVLREVEAKRRIIDLHSGDHECSTIRRGTDWDGKPYEEIDNCTWVINGDCSTVRLLALPYSDRPGYREEWRP